MRWYKERKVRVGREEEDGLSGQTEHSTLTHPLFRYVDVWID